MGEGNRDSAGRPVGVTSTQGFESGLKKPDEAWQAAAVLCSPSLPPVFCHTRCKPGTAHAEGLQVPGHPSAQGCFPPLNPAEPSPQPVPHGRGRPKEQEGRRCLRPEHGPWSVRDGASAGAAAPDNRRWQAGRPLRRRRGAGSDGPAGPRSAGSPRRR